MNNDDEREDMLSILRRYRPMYFAVFVIQVIVWYVIVYWWSPHQASTPMIRLARSLQSG